MVNIVTSSPAVSELAPLAAKLVARVPRTTSVVMNVNPKKASVAVGTEEHLLFGSLLASLVVFLFRNVRDLIVEILARDPAGLPEPDETGVSEALRAEIEEHLAELSRRAAALIAGSRELVLDCGDGVRLQAWHAPPPDPCSRLAILLHGWEGHGAQLGAFAAPLVKAGFRVMAFLLVFAGLLAQRARAAEARADGGVDAEFSAEPAEMKALVEACHDAAKAIGSTSAWRTDAEAESTRLRPSLYVTASAKAGDTITHENVRSVRPGGGLAPKHLDAVIGQKFVVDVEPGTPVQWGIVG